MSRYSLKKLLTETHINRDSFLDLVDRFAEQGYTYYPLDKYEVDFSKISIFLWLEEQAGDNVKAFTFAPQRKGSGDVTGIGIFAMPGERYYFFDDANEEDDVTGILIGTQGGGGEPNSNTGSDVNVGNPGGPASSGGTGSPGGNGGDGATYNTPWGTQRSPSQNELPGGNEAADFTHELHRNTEGINDAGDQVLSPDDYDFIQDSYQSHYQNQLADGKTPDQAKASAQYHSLMMAEALGAEVDWDKYPDAKALKEQNEKEQKERLGPGGGEGGGGGRDGDGGRSSNPGHTGPGTDLKPEITISEV